QLQSTGSTVNIMSNDTSRLFDSIILFHFLWIAPIILVIVLVLMIVEVGVAALAGAALLAVLSPAQVWISRIISRNRREMLKHSDARVRVINETLQGIRVVKLYAWEEALLAKIAALREKELGRLRYSLLFNALNQMILFVSPTVT